MAAKRKAGFRYRRIEGVWFRLVREGREPMDFSRTRAAGGRYNRPGSHPALYLGDQPATCLLEVLVHAGRLEAAYDLVPVSLRLRRVADVATAAGRRRAGASLDDLVEPPSVVRSSRGDIVGARHGNTWELGERAFASGADGLVVPSAAIRGQEVLVLFERDGPAGRVRVLRSRTLPIDPRMRASGK